MAVSFMLLNQAVQSPSLESYFSDNLLQPIDKQSLLDSGIFCCLIHILNALLDPDEANQREKTASYEEKSVFGEDHNGRGGQGRRLEVTSNFFSFFFIIFLAMCLCMSR